MKVLSRPFVDFVDGVKVRTMGRGRCDCGNVVALGWGDSTCRGCGAEYNSAGQRLAPREQWGEETGEHPDDVARAFTADP